MTRDEIVRLLQTAAAFDNRTIADAAAHAWADSAERGRWTYHEASEAIKAHYTDCTDFVMPAHIAKRIKAARNDRAMREPVVAPDPVGQARVARMLSGAFQTTTDEQTPPWKQAITAAKRDAKARRERVLRYPDIAAKLTQPPLNLADPTMWNGYIPPRTLPGRDDEPYDKSNDSPVRQQLVAIAAEALQRGVPA